MQLTQLIHSGVLVPPAPEPRGLVLTVRGQPFKLTPPQEEMALAWAKKQGTEYVEDPVFVENFMRDFSAALGASQPLSLDEVDFGAAVRVVEVERAAKEGLMPEERKASAALRKVERERLREQYGYATVNGERTELGTYLAEPSGIFMGRGKHPLRGRWKRGAQPGDITLNLSPDAPRPAGEWKQIVWEPETMWVARWEDHLSGKTKYIWLGDTSSAKQQREAKKFDKATALCARLEQVRTHVAAGLVDPDSRRRMVATAVYLIDNLGMRVGDEKDPDEADTVGATTLRPEHVRLHPAGVAEFRFLGKDSVEWHKKLQLPEAVQRNLAELIQNARPPKRANHRDRHHPTRDKPQLFPDVDSHDVNAFLSEIMPGLSAKVFRTHHATLKVEETLEGSGVQAQSPEYEKWLAVNLANLSAAEFCNHTKKAGVNWTARKGEFAMREDKAEQRVRQAKEQLKEAKEALSALRKEARAQVAAASPKQHDKKKAAYQKKIARTERQVSVAQSKLDKAEYALGNLKAQALVASKKRTWNLTTSLKSYVDPRAFYRWGQRVDYDVLGRYYPTTLRRKFSWVRQPDEASEQDE
jgi:DNA topoisomerase-1